MKKAPLEFLDEMSEWGSMSLGLDRVRLCLKRLGHLERLFGHTVVSGTNGKGTVALNLSKGLNGRIGLFCSPHVFDIRERITLAGDYIQDQVWQSAYDRIIKADPDAGKELSYFEWLLVLAVVMFSELNVEHAVFECGLGGLTDAVNALEPQRCVLTNVALDHCAILGNSLEEIALHKVGIARRGAPFWIPQWVLNLDGVTEFLAESGAVVKPLAVEHGYEANFQMVTKILADQGITYHKRASLRGRREMLMWGKGLILDGAHNPEAWRVLLDWAVNLLDEKPNIALSVSKGREPREFLAMAVDYGLQVFRFESGHERELPSQSWPDIRSIKDVSLDQLREKPLLATGSLYMLDEFCNWLNLKHC